ncbi:MAG: insulinase family protein [Deltaproteobacteria bacterium]|nr:insulinase family protein [Deltaproteobacteria bacterium]
MIPRRLALAAAVALTACAPKPATVKLPEKSAVIPSTDPLAERPSLGAPVPFKPVQPEVFVTAEGLTVWLVARPALPLVSLALMVPTGSADDPKERPGLAHITADMLDEGAGTRGAIAISTAIEDLGARLSTSAALDGSTIALTVIKKHLGVGFEIFADVAARPRFDEAEYRRVTELWQNALKRRDDDPQSVARVVRAAVLFGPDAPYGHPTSGRLEVAKALTLDEVKAFHAAHYRPDRATLVVAGDLTRGELEALLAKHLASWKRPAAPPPARAVPTPPRAKRPRLVLVDRPEAPQSVLAYIAPGVKASDPGAPPLELVNTALGGSFASRLNQNLREDHHWTYGAGSSFVETRGQGPFIAQAPVFVDATAPALRELLAEIAKMRDAGPTDDEIARGRARDLFDLMQTQETLGNFVSRLADLAELGLPPDHDSRASVARQAATRASLAALAKQHLDPSLASIIVVGPRAVVEPQLGVLGLGEPELWTAQGLPASATK